MFNQCKIKIMKLINHSIYKKVTNNQDLILPIQDCIKGHSVLESYQNNLQKVTKHVIQIVTIHTAKMYLHRQNKAKIKVLYILQTQ